ncbi:MAG: prolyl oligopeptidase family serine peptidase [Bacteroidaceae bacterium]|nr:prolyl oligopeptidase family serine peptidase [Bacteroidaceae bacterium]
MKHSSIIHFSFLIISSSFITLTATAQGTIQDYKNAYAIRGKYSNKMTYGNVRILPNRRRSEENPHTFIYSVQSDTGTVYKKVDADANTVTILPGNPEPPRRNRQNQGPQRHWMEVPDEKDGFRRNHAGTASIYHKDNNLWIRTQNDSIGKALTTNGDSTYYYSSWGSFSPDDKYYATVRIKPAPKHYVYYVESSPRNQVQPILHKQEYAKPGDSLNYRVPVIVEVATGKVTEVPTQYIASQYNVSAPSWEEDSKSVTFEFNERGHHNFYVYEFFAETGEVRTLIREHSDKYINYGRQYRYDFRNGKYILWTSERDNYNNIYLYDRKTGKLIRQITKGGYYVRGIQRVDEEKGIIYFSANGKTGLRESDKRGKNAVFTGTNATEEDPYLIHYYKINLNGKGLTCLTPEEGNHKATYTDDMKYLIDTYSTVLNPPVTVLRSATDGTILRTLETADISRLRDNGWKEPEVFVAKGRDGKTDMWGLIQRPTNFDPSKKYPVIEYIYSGPGDQYVPKDFTPWLWNLADLAELGFIVVQLDGMSTSFRSREFEEVCYKNLADSGFPDRIAWIKAAAEKYPYMDADNVGIYGCSAGGQEALGAVLFHGDFYKAAYAACGCHDNRMDKIWWNEQWMSYPIDSSYIASSNVENAHRLERPLMLVVGELDDNVDPASTMQVVNALQKANKDFELVVIPGAHHTMGESYGEHKRYDFFVRHLLGIRPPRWNDIK